MRRSVLLLTGAVLGLTASLGACKKKAKDAPPKDPPPAEMMGPPSGAMGRPAAKPNPAPAMKQPAAAPATAKRPPDTRRHKTIDPKIRDRFAAANLAGRVAEWGRQWKHPGALLLAARILTGHAIKPLEGFQPKEGEKVSGFGQKKLVAEALAMATAQKKLPLVKKLQQTLDALGVKARGTLQGGNCLHGRTSPGKEVVYNLTFKAKMPAIVSVGAADQSKLECAARDLANRVADDDDGQQCVLNWTPDKTGSHAIRIKHQGKKPTRYTLCVN